jgi:hypothetical protein
LLHINQAMVMFVWPEGITHWYVVPATFHDGTKADLYLAGGDLVRQRPALSSNFRLLRSHWGLFWLNLENQPWSRAHVGEYLCRRLRHHQPDGPRLASIQVLGMHQGGAAEHERTRVERVLLLEHRCQGEGGRGR